MKHLSAIKNFIIEPNHRFKHLKYSQCVIAETDTLNLTINHNK